MGKLISYFIVSLTLMFAVSAISAEAFLSKSDVVSHVSGNTEIWTKGGAYYIDDGSLKVVWKGKKSSGTWEVSEEGKICVIVKMWGDGKECHQYINDKGTVKLFFEGKARVAKIESGNQLNSL